MTTSHESFIQQIDEAELGCEFADLLVRTGVRSAGTAGSTAAQSVPSGVILMEQAAAALRAYLGRKGLGQWRIFYESKSDLYDLDHHLAGVGEPDAAWEPMGAFSRDGGMASVSCGGEGPLWPQGFLHLRGAGVVVARWYWIDAMPHGSLRSLWLYAAPTFDHYRRLRGRLTECRKARGEAVWQVVRSGCDTEGTRVKRDPASIGSLILSPELVQRVEGDLVRFFTDGVAKLYRELGMPYRRGVLLHGPPGNGKTSLIRLLGARLPTVTGLLLRVAAGFDSDDFEEIVKRWREVAPAVLVIEDLNWLLKQVNVSTFLNLLDGVDTESLPAGLMLVATTNHPEELDPAINNRPGRFDVVIEIPLPDEKLRLAFLKSKLSEIGLADLERAARQTEHLSFAHLQEVLRMSGLLALEDGRGKREAGDLHRAVETVRSAVEAARDGFAPKLDAPFGLRPRRVDRE